MPHHHPDLFGFQGHALPEALNLDAPPFPLLIAAQPAPAPVLLRKALWQRPGELGRGADPQAQQVALEVRLLMVHEGGAGVDAAVVVEQLQVCSGAAEQQGLSGWPRVSIVNS